MDKLKLIVTQLGQDEPNLIAKNDQKYKDLS